MKLSNSTNSYFTKFMKDLLNSSAMVNYFVFNLEGFELLLDIIGKQD